MHTEGGHGVQMQVCVVDGAWGKVTDASGTDK